tara:strand:- start:696 stop:887 length:192 start_codon:yes stop_codon:yes gene_type:complete
MNILKSVKVSNAMTGFTQVQLAKHLKFTQPWLGKMLKDNNSKHIGSMAAFYSVSTSEFIKRGE